MKKNELISMVDFVLAEELERKKEKHFIDSATSYLYYINQYAHFLNTPLNISQFVPAIKVGDKWEVLEMPKFALNRFEGTHTSSTAYWSAKMQYLTVKDNVIFEGFKLDGKFISHDQVSYLIDRLHYNTIQDLIKYKPTLTKKGLEVSELNR